MDLQGPDNVAPNPEGAGNDITKSSEPLEVTEGGDGTECPPDLDQRKQEAKDKTSNLMTSHFISTASNTWETEDASAADREEGELSSGEDDDDDDDDGESAGSMGRSKKRARLEQSSSRVNSSMEVRGLSDANPLPRDNHTNPINVEG